jgi:hypothetical protein
VAWKIATKIYSDTITKSKNDFCKTFEVIAEKDYFRTRFFNVKSNRMIKYIVSLFLFAVCIFAGCSESSHPIQTPENNKIIFRVFGEYTNTNGTTPSFLIDTDSTSSTITFANVTAMQQGSFVHLLLQNLSVSDSHWNYAIQTVRTDEFVNNKWITDAEFNSSFQKLTKIAVVLVLDVSNSLGTDFTNVKKYAKEFAKIVSQNSFDSATNMPKAVFGVVGFSDSIFQRSLLPPNNPLIGKFIDSLHQGQFTAMFDAMAQGIEMLADSSLIVDSKALITFTDGTDNFSVTTSDSILARLVKHRIKSYTIGLRGKGNLDEEILKSLAVKGAYDFANSSSDLQGVFKKFSNSVSDVYDVIYTRNNQIIPAARKMRFNITAKKKQ